HSSWACSSPLRTSSARRYSLYPFTCSTSLALSCRAYLRFANRTKATTRSPATEHIDTGAVSRHLTFARVIDEKVLAAMRFVAARLLRFQWRRRHHRGQ